MLLCCAAEKFESRSRIERPPGGPEAWGCRETCACMHGGQAEIGPYLVLKGANAPIYQPYVDKGGHTPPRFCAKLSNNALCAPRDSPLHRRRTLSGTEPTVRISSPPNGEVEPAFRRPDVGDVRPPFLSGPSALKSCATRLGATGQACSLSVVRLKRRFCRAINRFSRISRAVRCLPISWLSSTRSRCKRGLP